MDCKATVLIGEVSRGGLTRGDNQAWDHDLGLHEKYIPCGIVDEESGQLRMTFGSSFKTSDFIVDALEAWWAALDASEQVAAYSGRRLPLIPVETCHRFQSKVATDSD
jgi:Rhodopirellula transposase DDE domain